MRVLRPFKTREKLMFGLQSLQINPKKVLSKLQEFENFCLGKKALSPDEFKTLNMELSVGSVLHIGKRRFHKDLDGKHLLWTGLDDREYDLGPVHKLNVMHKCPGFNRASTMSLGNNLVRDNQTIEIPTLKKQISVVRLEDGSVGIGPNYKLALRNAALKMHLKKSFILSNPPDAWKEHYSNA